MYLALDYIKFFIEEKKLDKNIDSENFKSFLGISKIEKKGNIWDVYIKGPKDSLYEGGLYRLSINFPLLYPKKPPEVCFFNKIYHLNVCPTNGRLNVIFLLNWDETTTYAELLVGIYLFFIFEQNCESPYSREMAIKYKDNRDEFDKKAKLWVTKFASGKQNDLYEVKHENLMGKCKEREKDNKIDFLIKKVNKLEKDLNFYSNKVIELLEKLKSNNQNEGIPNNLISIIFQSLDKKVHCSIICKETDVFKNVESSLYKKYPEYLESEQYFIVNGKTIDKIKTLKENGIKDNDIILLYVNEMDGQ